MKTLNEESLEDVAKWLDLSDELLLEYADLLEWCAKYNIFDDISFDKKERLIELIRKTCGKTGMQDDIRSWAKHMEDDPMYDICPYDCDNCNP